MSTKTKLFDWNKQNKLHCDALDRERKKLRVGEHRTIEQIRQHIRENMPGFHELPEDFTNDDLYRHCEVLKARVGQGPNPYVKRYFSGGTFKTMVERLREEGIRDETIMECNLLTRAQFEKLMREDFNEVLVVKPIKRDEGPETWEDLET